jgi:hypothetical protein
LFGRQAEFKQYRVKYFQNFSSLLYLQTCWNCQILRLHFFGVFLGSIICCLADHLLIISAYSLWLIKISTFFALLIPSKVCPFQLIAFIHVLLFSSRLQVSFVHRPSF